MFERTTPILSESYHPLTTMRQALKELVQSHTPFDHTEAIHTQATHEFLLRNENCVSRSNLHGHITASAWLLCPQKKQTLLTHHKKLDRWLQPGGHIEDDDTVQEAALREAREESGIIDLRMSGSSIFDIDVHKIPANKEVPEHLHYDLRFLLIAGHMELVISEESNDLTWVDINSVAELVHDTSILRMAQKCAI